MAKNDAIILITPLFRMSYPNLVDPKPYKDPKTGITGDPTFNVQMVFDPEVLGEFHQSTDEGFIKVDIKELAKQIANSEWPGQKLAELFPGTEGWPVKDGNKLKAKQEAKGKKGDVYTDKWVITAKSNEEYPPRLKVFDKGQKVDLDRDDKGDRDRAKKLFVGGNYARAELNVKPQEVSGRKYISVYLNNILFLKEGQKLGQGSAMDRFDGIDGGSSDFDPTDGLDEEVNF